VKKSSFFAVILLMLISFQIAVPSSSAAVERKLVDANPVELKACSLKLLKNRDYFQALSEKIRDAGQQITMAFFLFKTNGHPESYPEIILRELSQAVQRGVRVTVVLGVTETLPQRSTGTTGRRRKG
jgi:phosphatidylserine/phosphatidylglycerophosphate/cardiolipin synthase-like enzyme